MISSSEFQFFRPSRKSYGATERFSFFSQDLLDQKLTQKLTFLEGGIFEDLLFFLNRSHQELPGNITFIFCTISIKRENEKSS